MFKIGDFSKFARVSIKMLRHYDQLGLLKPARVDPLTNYRYYSADQLPRLNRLLALRALGFSLDQIAPLLSDDMPVEQLARLLRQEQTELEQHLRDEHKRLAAVRARLRQIERGGRSDPVDVVVRPVAPQTAACLRQFVDDDGVHLLFEAVERRVAAHGARANGPPLAIFHDGEYRQDGLDIEVAIPLKAMIPATNRIRVQTLPGCSSMACLVHTGSYDTIGDANAALLRWIESNSYQIAGPIREVYLRFNADGLEVSLPEAYLARSADDFVTELQLPVALGAAHAS